MDTKTVFVLTSKGEEEVSHRTSILDGDIKRALSMVDGTSSFAEISKRAAPSLRSMLDDLLKDLLKRGYIQDKTKAGGGAKTVVPPKMAVPKIVKPEQSGTGELDFTSMFRAPSAEELRAAGEQIKAKSAELETVKNVQQNEESEDARKTREHEQRLRSIQEAQAQEQAKTKALAEEARLKAEQETQLKVEADAKAEALRLKAEQEARRTKEETDKRARAQAEFARLKAEQEADVARKEAELAKKKAEAEAKARDFAERRAKIEAEAARMKAEQEAGRVKAEIDAVRAKAAAETRARAEAEEKIKQAAEVARLQAEQAAAKAKEENDRIKREAEAAAAKAKEESERIKREAELAAEKAKEETARVKREAEAAAAKAKEESDRIKREAELAAVKAKEEAERIRRESEMAAAKAKEESERIKREAELAAVKAKEEAERSKRESEMAAAKAKEESDRIKREAELAAAKAKEETERVKRDAEIQAKLIEETARKAQQQADEARLKAEQEAARAREELQAEKQKSELENQARLEAETLRLAEERATEQTRSSIAQAAIQAVIQERELVQQALDQQVIKAREEEQIKAKQLALAAVSTLVRDTSTEAYPSAEIAPSVKLDSINFDALIVKPLAATEAAKPDTTVAPAPANEVQAAQESSGKTLPTDDVAAKELALKEQIRKAEEERLEAELAAKKLADSQAKAWAEAELRAIEAAKMHASFQAEQVVHATQVKHQVDKKLRAAQSRNKPIPWGGMTAGLLVLVLLALFLVPMLMPTQEYASKLEKLLADKLHQPVHVGKLSGRILPTPQIELGEIYIGEIKQIKAQQAQLSFGFGALFGEVKHINRLELDGAEINGSGLLDVPDWLQKLSADSKYPISKIVFNAAKLNGDAVQISDLAGEVNFDSAGQFGNAILQANSGKTVLDIKSSAHGLDAVLNVKNSALPLLPNWNFEELTAKGELSRDGFVIDDLDGRIADGILQGKARIDWKSGWSVHGSLDAKSVSLASINKLLTGDMDGAATFKMQSDTLSNLPNTVVLEGSVAAKKGVIDGVDIIETARLHSKETLPGGRTHFDEMSSSLTYNNDAYHFKSMKIANSVLNSSGNMDVIKQQLTGRLSAHLSIQEGMGTVELQIGGATSNPTLRAR